MFGWGIERHITSLSDFAIIVGMLPVALVCDASVLELVERVKCSRLQAEMDNGLSSIDTAQVYQSLGYLTPVVIHRIG